jgi:hypothetical protein
VSRRGIERAVRLSRSARPRGVVVNLGPDTKRRVCVADAHAVVDRGPDDEAWSAARFR